MRKTVGYSVLGALSLVGGILAVWLIVSEGPDLSPETFEVMFSIEDCQQRYFLCVERKRRRIDGIYGWGLQRERDVNQD